MKREKELVKNTVVLALGKFLPKVVSLVTLPIVTAQLSKNEYGTYDLVQTLVMLLMPVATLQIQSAAFRYLIDYRGNKKESSKIITDIFAVTVSIALTVAVVFMFLARSINPLTRFIVVMYFLSDILFNTISQVARGLGYNKVFSISAIVLSAVNGIGVVLLVQFLGFGLNGVLISLAVSSLLAVAYIAFCIRIGEYFDFSLFEWNRTRELISYSWPMIPNNLSNWVLKLSDRLVITGFLGVESNAEYAVANKIPNLLSIAQSVFVMAWQENASLAVSDADAEKYYSDMFDRIFTLMIGCTGVLIAFTPLMFKILIRGDYDAAYMQMPILILGMFFYCMSAFQGGIYIAHKKTKSVGMTTVVAAVINLAIDLLLVNRIGITAGSLSSLIAYFALYLFRLVNVSKIQPITYKYGKQAFYIAVMIVMLFLCSKRHLYTNIINYYLAAVVFAFANRNFIKDFFEKTKRHIIK